MQRKPFAPPRYTMWFLRGQSGLFTAAADKSQIQIVRDGAPHFFEAKDDDGKTALMIAAENQNAEAVDILIAAGTDVNLQDHEDQTALQKAVVRPTGGAEDSWQPEVAVQIVKSLVAAGADVHATHQPHGAFGKVKVG